eukprot:TRINITY_DN11054_c0_g1_i1.p1 TRINITY_DN11054_c0_g1~~TRINITY_DN11054_c0_g1_i1.p1  ORF type:complete len:492 (-),score=108.45 TRINITY_DN11054_c0_g1_i1:153-1454(-)
MACRQLPPDAVHAAAAERLLSLALAEVPAGQLHGQSSDARGILLRAMRHVMGGDVAVLCRGLGERILPTLRQAAEAEAMSPQRTSSADAARFLIAALCAVLPPKGSAPVSDSQHPVVLLWRQQWECLAAPLLRWPFTVSSSSSLGAEQPLTVAAEAVACGAIALPILLPESLEVLVESIVKGHASSPEAPLRALEQLVHQLPCPPLEAGVAADLVGGAVLRATEALLSREDFHRSPSALKELYRLHSRGLHDGKAAPCGGLLRQRLLSKTSLTARLLSLFCESLPGAGAASAATAEALLRWAVNLVPKASSKESLETSSGSYSALLQALPGLCGATCRALAEQEHLARFDGGFLEAGELLYYLAEAFPSEISAAFSAGLQSLHGVPGWSRHRFLQHVQRRHEWPNRSAWISDVQQTVQDWQREMSQAFHRLPS